MKFYINNSVKYGVNLERENGRKGYIKVDPPTVGPKVTSIFVLIADEFETIENGMDVNIGLVGDNETPMLFPPPESEDNRILLFLTIDSPSHRKDGYLINDTDVNIIKKSSGYGAWGAGQVFLVVLNLGEHIVSNTYNVWENNGGELKTRSFENEDEYSFYNKKDNIDIQML